MGTEPFRRRPPGVIVVTPQQDGTLKVQQQLTGPAAQEVSYSSDGKTAASPNAYGRDAASDGRYAPELTAYRPDVAQAKGLPAPDDFLTHTVARDPNEKFTFNFRDVNGKQVSNEDPLFKNKVVLAIVTGTWCPNCHDEAQYLVQLDKKYRGQGPGHRRTGLRGA